MKDGNANFFGFGAAAMFGPPEAFNDDYLDDPAPAADNNDNADNNDADAPYYAACDRAALAAAPAAC